MSARSAARAGGRRGAAIGARAAETAKEGSAPRWKVWLVLALVAVVAIWPLAHRVLVATHDVNPWKLGGFAMYTTPRPPLLIAVFVSTRGRIVRLEEGALPARVRTALRRFEQERHALGGLRRPDDVAALLLASRAELAQVAFLVQQMSLDRDSARTVARKTQYTYDRSGLRAER